MKYAVEVSALLEIEADSPEEAAGLAGTAAVEDPLNFDVIVKAWPGDGESEVLFTTNTNDAAF